MVTHAALAVGLFLASETGAVCPSGWPAVEPVSSLEALVDHRVSGPVFDLLDLRGEGRVVVFDFRSRSEQNKMFDPVSTFTESASHQGRIGQGQGMTDYDGHNLLTASLASYFRSAEERGVVLPKEEQELLSGLICEGLLIRVDGGLIGKPRTAVLAVNHDPSLEDARAAIVSHELYHGLDMTDEEHWQSTRENWESLRASQRRIWKSLVLGQRGYDSTDKRLLMAEVGAYGGMFGLEKILRLRQSRDLGALRRADLEEIRRGRSFEGVLDVLAFEGPAFLFEMEYGFERSSMASFDMFTSPGLSTGAIVLPDLATFRRSLGRIELERITGESLTIFDVDSGRLERLLRPRVESEVAIRGKRIWSSELVERLEALDKRLPEEERLLGFAKALEARAPSTSLVIMADCGTCTSETRLAWLIFQLELLVGRSDEAVLEQASEDWRIMKRLDRQAYEEVFSGLGLQLSPDETVLVARSAELAVKRSGLRSTSGLQALPTGAVEILLAGRRSVDSNHGPRTREQ